MSGIWWTHPTCTVSFISKESTYVPIYVHNILSICACKFGTEFISLNRDLFISQLIRFIQRTVHKYWQKEWIVSLWSLHFFMFVNLSKYVLPIQVNFCISNTDISNTMQVSKWDDGPNRFYYIYDLRNPGISNTLISNTLLISK